VLNPVDDIRITGRAAIAYAAQRGRTINCLASEDPASIWITFDPEQLLDLLTHIVVVCRIEDPIGREIDNWSTLYIMVSSELNDTITIGSGFRVDWSRSDCMRSQALVAWAAIPVEVHRQLWDLASAGTLDLSHLLVSRVQEVLP
jgi:hypothetical protein